METMKQGLKKFLKLPAKKSGLRCRVCCDPRVANDLADWATARAAGGPHTLNGFYEGYLLKNYATPPSRNSVRHHVTNCLRLLVANASPIQNGQE
jgi:hypothetical protein